MAGGKGKRLLPLTLKTPKPLLKVGDKTIIEHNIKRLNILELIICLYQLIIWDRK